MTRTCLRLWLTFVAALLAGGVSAFALDDDDSISSAGSALSSQQHPWYDAEADDVRPLYVEPKAAPPEPDYPDWQWSPATSTAPTTTPNLWGLYEWFFFLLLLLVFAAITGALVYFFLRYDRAPSATSSTTAPAPTEADRIENLPFPVRRPQGDLLDEARRQYEAGNYNEAIVYLYSYELVQLDRHQLIRLAQGKTNRQYLREVRSRDDLSSLLERTMVAFEDVFFGHHALSRERFESCWGTLTQFHHSVGASA